MDGISLGFPLDLLLNRHCKPIDFDSDKNRRTINHELDGIIFPDNDSAGTGNIIIEGRPGTGKSTLALQMAVSCVQKGNDCSAAYFSLEEQTNHLLSKADRLGWRSWLYRMDKINILGESASSADLGKYLINVLLEHEKKNKRSIKDDGHEKNHSPIVLLPSLSPRSIVPSDIQENKLFWERYQQLENFLEAADWINNADNKANIPPLRMVFLDSLNTFGDRLLDREELFRIFDLFKRHHIIGVFILEVNDSGSEHSINHLHQNTIEYMADTVISLKTCEDQGYYSRFLEIEKSRYQHQVYGKHPFRLKDIQPTNNDQEFTQAYNIFPSLHYLVSVIGREENQNPELPPVKNPLDFGIEGMEWILPKHLSSNSIITIEGPKASFKTSMAENFLIRGLMNGESGLLIRLQDNLSFNKEKIRLNKGLLKYFPRGNDSNLNEKLQFMNILDNLEEDTDGRLFNEYRHSVKIKETEWRYKGKDSLLIELAFGEGMLLAEEFIQIVNTIFKKLSEKKKPIKYVVFDDVSLIGISYPFIKGSITASDLFLPSFVHLMRSYGAGLLMIGTTGDLKETNEYVNRATALADTVISCRNCDIFGDKYVIVSGEGLVVRMIKEAGMREPVPGVIRIDRRQWEEDDDAAKSKVLSPFVLDLDFLQGLVGFETQRIHRPGLSLHLMEASAETRVYNQEVEKLLQFALAKPTPSVTERRKNLDIGSDVSVIPFDTRIAEPMYGSFNLLQDAPIERTVVCTLDEFLGSEKNTNKSWVKITNNSVKNQKPKHNKSGQVLEQKEESEFIVQDNDSGRPYYGNVLVLAYRSGYLNLKENDFSSWHSILNAVKKVKTIDIGNDPNPIREPFDYGILSHETMSCIFLDSLISGMIQAKTISPDFDLDSLSKIITKKSIQKAFNNELFRNEIKAVSSLIQLRNSLPPYIPINMESRLIEIEYKGINDLNNYSKELRVPMYEILEANHTKQDELYEGQLINIPIKCSIRPDSAVYLCWYSQIRELINQYPNLAGSLEICALPGRGVSGDWFLGIIKGSVSIQLGEKVINMLCDETEDLKRYNRGIGIPMRKGFYGKNLKAWLGTNIDLDKVLEIHNNALRRSKIDDYTIIRHAFSNALQELLYSKIVDDLFLKKIFDSLIEQIENQKKKQIEPPVLVN